MTFRLSPVSAPGEELVARIHAVCPVLRENAAAADAANRICEPNYRLLQEKGIAGAFVPKSLGGLDLNSMHDWIVALCELARGDGSTAIAMSMHFSASRGMAARHRALPEGSADAEALGNALRQIAAGEMLICSTTTESGHDNLHPHTEATRLDEGGWRVDGRKFFVTMSPLATHISLNVRMRDDAGDHIANVFTRMDTPGIHQHGDWDALGMRASGSQSVSFDNCQVPGGALRVIGPWGQWSIPVLLHRTLANVPLVAAFLGIAEAAHGLALDAMKAPKQAGRAGVQHAVAEMEVALTTCQALMDRIGRRLDEVMMAPDELTWEAGHELMKDYQSVKWVVNRSAIDIVSRAMDLFGGRGYLAGNTLTRLYRDVRAGPFMQPHSPIDAREYIGQVALEQYPLR